MRMTTKQAARGKWDAILTQLIGEHAVSRRHGPCPICVGKDRYRYDNKRNDGDWFCNVCGVGDGFRLLQESLGIDFATAASEVDKIVNNFEAEPFRESIDIDRRRQSLNDTWKHAKSPRTCGEYLRSRGIPIEQIAECNDLRGHGKLRHIDNNKNYTYRPAMLGLIRNSKGEPISIHRTYIGLLPKEKKIMPPLENITGSCVRLGEPQDCLVLAEGIESALAAWALTGHPAWATISAHGLAEMKSIPRHVKRVIVCADNDRSFTGQEAAFACAKTMRQKLKVGTSVVMPRHIGTDMADVLAELGGDPTLLGDQLMRWTP